MVSTFFSPTFPDPIQCVIGLVARELADAVGPDHVSADPKDLEAQADDWSWMSQYMRYKNLPHPTADIAVHPANAEEVAACVRIASDFGMPVVPRGGGSGTQGGGDGAPPTSR